MGPGSLLDFLPVIASVQKSVALLSSISSFFGGVTESRWSAAVSVVDEAGDVHSVFRRFDCFRRRLANQRFTCKRRRNQDEIAHGNIDSTHVSSNSGHWSREGGGRCGVRGSRRGKANGRWARR